MTMRYHWGLAVGHLYTHTSSHQPVAPISTDPRHDLEMIDQDGDNGSLDKDEGGISTPMSTNSALEGMRHDLDTVEQRADGGDGPQDKDKGEIPDTASDVSDRGHWDHEAGYWDDEGSDMTFEHDSDSDSNSQHSRTDSETDSVLLELQGMYGDTLNVEWTSYD
jgi:hypothetical protein